MKTEDSGFTLIEALVAMAVLAVAATGFVRATEGHIDLIGRIEARAGGGWAAENGLTEARLGLQPMAAPLLGRAWQPVATTRASDDPDITAVTVTTKAVNTSVTMHGFRDMGATVAAAARPR